jgi:hypothetical protein
LRNGRAIDFLHEYNLFHLFEPDPPCPVKSSGQWEEIMRKTLFGLAILAAAMAMLPTPGQAIEYPWCAQYGGRGGDGGRNCGFTTFQQCMATVSGIGGFCERNLFYQGPARAEVRKHKRNEKSY